MRNRSIYYIIVFLLLLNLSFASFSAEKKQSPLQFQVSGLVGKPLINVQLVLKNLQTHFHPAMTQIEVLHYYDKAPKEIRNALAPYGFFQAHIQSSLIKIPGGWLAKYAVTVGSPMLISTVKIDIQGAGKTDSNFEKIIQETEIKPGAILHTQKYETLKTNLYNIATQRGYFNAKMIKSNIIINLNTNRSDIIIIFNTGNRFRFGKTTFSKTPLYNKFLRRFLQYKEGEYYDAKKAEETQASLVSSQYFNQALINPEPKKAVNDVVPMYISLIPRKSKEYTAGLGYGTDTGIRGTLGITLRELNGWGHRFETYLRASQDNSSFIMKYLIPGPNPGRDLFTLAAGYTNINQTTGNGNSFKLGPDYTMTSGHWKNTFALAYLNEEYNLIAVPQTSTQLVYPTVAFRYLNTDNKTQPQNGFVFHTQLSGANEHLLSETTFTQIIASAKTLSTIQKTHTRFLFRVDTGYTDITNLDQLPLSLQLFAGGSRSIRGYQYNAIGPGRDLLVGSVEIQQRVKKEWYLAAFVDAGSINDDAQILQNPSIGIGPGVVWLSSFGMLELTVANAVTQPNKPWVIQFMMGKSI